MEKNNKKNYIVTFDKETEDKLELLTELFNVDREFSAKEWSSEDVISYLIEQGIEMELNYYKGRETKPGRGDVNVIR